MVGPYMDDHKKILCSKYLRKFKAYITHYYIYTFVAWLQQHIMCNETMNDLPGWLEDHLT
jgi:hypothetical protein